MKHIAPSTRKTIRARWEWATSCLPKGGGCPPNESAPPVKDTRLQHAEESKQRGRTSPHKKDNLMLLRHLMYSTALAALFAFTGLGTAHAADTTSVRIAHLQIKPEFLEAFTAAVKEEMEAALRVEPGVLAIYAVADKNDPTKLTFIEMYADEDAYQVHRDTPHFQKYFHATKDMIAERVLLEAVPVELRDKHNTPAAD